jgi:hypothetical protein
MIANGLLRLLAFSSLFLRRSLLRAFNAILGHQVAISASNIGKW